MEATSLQTSRAITSAPAAASRTAWARPWPLPAPVTNATLSVRSVMSVLSLFGSTEVVEAGGVVMEHLAEDVRAETAELRADELARDKRRAGRPWRHRGWVREVRLVEEVLGAEGLE